MKLKTRGVSIFVSINGLIAAVLADTCANSLQAMPVYRDFNDAIGDHFYTVCHRYANTGGYFAESARFAVFSTAQPSTTQFIRLYSGGLGDHFFTTDSAEASNAAATGGYVREDLAPMFIYAAQICGSIPLYRSYSSAKTDHFYTTSESERDNMEGYKFELIAGYVLPLNTTSSVASGQLAASTGSGSNSASALPSTTSSTNSTSTAIRACSGYSEYALSVSLLTSVVIFI
ncbi:hypothetical protein C8R47DRAFT_1218304 [Mycena vitilis]|nr:hypothetical protein C8R47DRAFT_1218304 [Mycena vitilis]